MTLHHVAIRPVRHDMIGEVVYARRWHELMNGVCQIHMVLAGYPYPVGQREASVAASFITWLGTNVGASLLDIAQEFKLVRAVPSFAYVAAWSVLNVRSFGHNSNARQIEFLTRTTEEMEANVFSEVSVRDLEVIDQIALWLGTEEGQKFLEGCMKEIEKRTDLERYATMVAAGRGTSIHARRLATKLVAQAAE